MSFRLWLFVLNCLVNGCAVWYKLCTVLVILVNLQFGKLGLAVLQVCTFGLVVLQLGVFVTLKGFVFLGKLAQFE